MNVVFVLNHLILKAEPYVFKNLLTKSKTYSWDTADLV